MASEEVGTKLVRFLYFVGAGVICTKGINLWQEYERKAAAVKADPTNQKMAHMPAEIVDASAAAASKS